MIRAFFFVTSRSFKNRMLSRLGRLREPRYLIGFVVGLVYIWMVWLRRMFSAHYYGVILPASDIAIDVMAILLVALAILVWAIPDAGGGLTFSEAEIQFLFSAPVSRRQLLIYKVFRSQPQIFISALMMTAFGFRSAHFIGLWLVFAGLSIYFTAVSLARARLKVAGIGFLARLLAVTTILVGFIGILIREVRTFPLDSFRPATITLDTHLASPFATPLLRKILFVPRIIAMTALPVSTAQLVTSCLVVIAIAALCLEIAARLNVAFEEASIGASQRQAANRARRSARPGTRVIFRRIPPPFRIPSKARPELAIVWKNLTASLRVSVAWVVFAIVILSAIFARTMLSSRGDVMTASAALALGFCALFPYFGSSVFNHDLRLDLSRIEILKSYPMTGRQLIAAEIAAPLMIISVIEIVLLLITTISLQFVPHLGALAFFATPEFVVIALLFAVPICATQLLLRNAIAILFPAWATRSAEEPRGFAVLGQRLVVMAGMLVLVLVALLPAAALFVPALYFSHEFFGATPIVLAIATMPAVAVLVAETWFILRFLGAQFDRIDVTTEIGTAFV